MKKVSLLMIVSIILLLAFSSCTVAFKDKLPELPFFNDNKEPGHTHAFAEEWASDTDSHYHACECGAREGSAAHSNYNDDLLCDVCGRELPPVEVEVVTHTVTVKATDADGKIILD